MHIYASPSAWKESRHVRARRLRKNSRPGRIRTCDTRPRKPLPLICESEKRLFLCGFCTIPFPQYHNYRLSSIEEGGESYGREGSSSQSRHVAGTTDRQYARAGGSGRRIYTSSDKRGGRSGPCRGRAWARLG